MTRIVDLLRHPAVRGHALPLLDRVLSHQKDNPGAHPLESALHGVATHVGERAVRQSD